MKPAKEIFSYSLTKSGALLNNSIMIGDDYKADILGAQNFGLKALYFTPNKKQIELKEDFEFSNFNQLLFLIPKVFQERIIKSKWINLFLQKNNLYHRGQIIDLDISEYAFGGKGIAKIVTEKGTLNVFINNAFPGQKVRAQIKKRENVFLKQNFLRF